MAPVLLIDYQCYIRTVNCLSPSLRFECFCSRGHLLSDPLIPFELYEQCLTAGKLADKPECEDECTRLLRSTLRLLPRSHQRLLCYLCRFWSKVAANAEINKMTARCVSS